MTETNKNGLKRKRETLENVSPKSRHSLDFDRNKEKWVSLSTNEIFKRSDFAMGVYQDRYILLAGGQIHSNKVDSCIKYDITNGKCTALPDLPHRFSSVCRGTVLKKKFFVFDQFFSSGIYMDITTCNKWVTLATPPIRFYAREVLAHGDLLYIFNGSNQNFTFHPDDNCWEALPKLDDPRPIKSIAACGNEIYVLGGYSRQFQPIVFMDIFNIQSRTWRPAHPLPENLMYCSAVTIGNFIVVIGCTDINCKETSRCFLFDTFKQKWTKNKMVETISPLEHHGYILIKDKVYCIGGRRSSLCDNWRIKLCKNCEEFSSLKSLSKKYLDPSWSRIEILIKLRALVQHHRATPRTSSIAEKAQKTCATLSRTDLLIQRFVAHSNSDLFRTILSFLIL